MLDQYLTSPNKPVTFCITWQQKLTEHLVTHCEGVTIKSVLNISQYSELRYQYCINNEKQIMHMNSEKDK